MSEMWKNWEGQVVDQKYQLRQYLGSTDHSVVFLAENQEAEPRQVAVKFISTDAAEREPQLAAWSAASLLSHPNLIRIYGAGQCRMEDLDLLYVVMEYAEENLSQVLPNRALMAEEATEMLNPVVDVLVYLHGKNLVHGHVKPSNILATSDSLKLSSDTIFQSGEMHAMRRERSAYDAPELPDRPCSTAADVWSLGVALVEALTQLPAALPYNEQADPIIPTVIRDPFLEIVRHALRREPRVRWSSAQIAERLNPAAVSVKAAAAGAGARASAGVSAGGSSPVTNPAIVSPLTVPLSKEPAIPLAKQTIPSAVRPEPKPTPRREERRPPQETVLLPNYVIPLFAVALLVIALIVLPFALRHRAGSRAGTPNTASAVNTNSATATQPNSASNNLQPSAKLPATKSGAESPVASPARPEPVTPATTAPAVLRDPSAAPPAKARNSSAPTGKGEVLDQVTPEAPAKALSTINGTVRVGVKVHVDAAGNVSEAALEDSGPSRYFADLSLKAARQWVFTPPEVNGRSVPSDWVIRFHFTRSGVQMSSQQVEP